jgi:microcystin-dependent protein
MPDTLETLRADIDALKAAEVPVGTLYVFLGVAAPVGYVMADGSTINPLDPQTAALAALIGNTYNLPGDAGGVCRLPNLCGRTMVGAGQGLGLTMRALGQLFGAETHQLTASELPGHTHSGKTKPQIQSFTAR